MGGPASFFSYFLGDGEAGVTWRGTVSLQSYGRREGWGVLAGIPKQF